MAKLTYAERQDLPSSDFAIPETREYPIEDIAHARNALARVSAFGDSEGKYRVRKAVYGRYPQLIPPKNIARYAIMPRHQIAERDKTATRAGLAGHRGEVRGKDAIKKIIKRENAAGRKVLVYYMGNAAHGVPIFRYQAWKMQPHLLRAGSRNQATGMMNLRRIHARRSDKAQATDEARENAVTIQSDDKRVEGWKHDPGSADVAGIDTKNKVVRGQIHKAEGSGIKRSNKVRRVGGAQKLEVKEIKGKFKNIAVLKDGKVVVAVAELDPTNPHIGNKYLRLDTARQKPTISSLPPTMHEDKGVQAVLEREFPVERIKSHHGTVTLTEVLHKSNRRYNPMVKEHIGEMKRKKSGVDLGAGVVREGRKQHIPLE
jgi:hypothetical protein